ncbi:MAG: hypothetical protein ACUVQY_05605 [Thermoproteota archaeon]
MLLSDLTDVQALNIANEVLGRTEVLKSLKQDELTEYLEQLVEATKNGEDAVKASQRLLKQAQYEKMVEQSIDDFARFVAYTDPNLANAVRELLKHLMNIIGPDAVEWLLNLMKANYLAYGNATGQFFADEANRRLRFIVYDILQFERSKQFGCAIASEKLSYLMKLNLEELDRYLASKEARWFIGKASFSDRLDLDRILYRGIYKITIFHRGEEHYGKRAEPKKSIMSSSIAMDIISILFALGKLVVPVLSREDGLRRC